MLQRLRISLLYPESTAQWYHIVQQGLPRSQTRPSFDQAAASSQLPARPIGKQPSKPAYSQGKESRGQQQYNEAAPPIQTYQEQTLQAEAEKAALSGEAKEPLTEVA